MPGPIYQVTLTYLTRWPVWLTAAIYAGLCSTALYLGIFNHSPTQFTNVFPEPRQPAPMVNLFTAKPLDGVRRDTRSLFVHFGRASNESNEVSQPFPELVSLQVIGSLDLPTAKNIFPKMPALRRVSLMCDVAPGVIHELGALPNLEFLRLHEIPAGTPNEDLGRLTQLKTLDILRVPDHSKLFPQIVNLTQLRTLIVSGPFDAGFQVSDWEPLSTMPRLTHLLLRGIKNGSVNTSQAFTQVRRVLPRIKVRPAEVHDLPTFAWMLMAAAGAIVTAGLMSQLQLQFTPATSRLTPHYASSHLTVAAGIWIVSQVIQTSILVWAGCNLLAAMAGNLLLPGVGTWVSWLAFRNSRMQINLFSVPTLMFPFVLQFCVFGMIGRAYILSDADWFLSGNQPILAGIVVLAGIAGPIVLLRKIPAFHTALQELGEDLPPIGVSQKEWQAWQMSQMQRQLGQRQNYWFRKQIDRIDKLLASAPRLQRSSLMLAGNAINGWMLSGGVCVVLLVMYPAMLISYRLFDFGFPDTATGSWGWIMQGSIVIDIMILVLFSTWHTRRQMFGYESLRPATRDQFVRQVFVSIARDLAPMLLTQLLVVIFMLIALYHRSSSAWFVPVGLICWILRSLFAYAALLYLVTVRSAWKLILGLGAAYLVFEAPLFYIAVVYFTPHGGYPIVELPVFLVGCAAVIAWLMRLERYWQRIEL